MRAIERYDSKVVEEEVRAFWKEKRIPQGLAEHRKNAKKYFERYIKEGGQNDEVRKLLARLQ